MELPEIHTAEELALLTNAEQVEYAAGLANKALEMLELSRDSFTVPAGEPGADARRLYNALALAAQNLRYQIEQAVA